MRHMFKHLDIGKLDIRNIVRYLDLSKEVMLRKLEFIKGKLSFQKES